MAKKNLSHFHSGHRGTSNLANSEDPDKMPQIPQGLLSILKQTLFRHYIAI